MESIKRPHESVIMNRFTWCVILVVATLAVSAVVIANPDGWANQLGWLDRAAFEPSVRKAWPALLARIGSDGSLIDVCEGTGKQTSRRAYLDRKAILGPDDRGGAMALLVATEMEASK